MSTAYQLYTALLPQALRKHLDPLQLRFHVWKKKTIKRKLSTPTAIRARRAKLRTIMSKRPLKVAFQVAQVSKWKCESVLRLMLEDDRFEPFIWCVPVSGVLHLMDPALHEQEVNRIISFFSQRNIPVYTYPSLKKFPASERPDLIFIHEAYDAIFPSESFQGLTGELICHVPYCFRNTTYKGECDGFGNNCAVFDFVENESYCAYQSANSTAQGRNCVVTGTPLADIFLSEEARTSPAWRDCGKPMKRVIWAPHWTITADLCYFTSGTFLKNADAMLELAQKYRDSIQFAFKPHPHLYRILCELPEWGKEKTDAYYRLWKDMPNTQLEEGQYTALFMQSDAIIHDSGSFILEYLFADKPCMFLRENEGYGNYNEQSIDCLRAYQFGLAKEDIDKFLQTSVLGTDDPLRDIRTTMRRRYLLPPDGKTAAQNIIDAILHA